MPRLAAYLVAKGAEILALRHHLAVLERHLHGQKIRFAPADRAFLAALLHRFPREVLSQGRLLVRPETVLRWHRDLLGGILPGGLTAVTKPTAHGRPHDFGAAQA